MTVPITTRASKGSPLTNNELDANFDNLKAAAEGVDAAIAAAKDVLSFANLAAFPATGAGSAIYIAEDKNELYRWDGAAYTLVGGPQPPGVYMYNTKAEANAAASGLADQALVMVLVDESLAGIKSLYRKESGSLVFKQELLTKDVVDAAVVDAEAAKTAAESARDAAQLSAGVYVDTAAGLAATTNGQYFSVPSADSAEYLILYKNNAGSAVEQKRYPSATGVAGLVSPIRVRNRYGDSGFVGATVPPVRTGTASLQTITDPTLVALGIAKGVATTATSTYVLVDIDPSWIGKYVMMSCFVHFTDGTTPTGASPSRYITTGATMDATGLSWRTDIIDANTKRLFAYGKIPAGVTKMAIGCSVGTVSNQHMITGVAYGIADTAILPDGFQHDVMYPVATPVESRATSLESRATSLESATYELEAAVEPLPINYVKNVLANGDMAVTPPAWTYTGTSPIASVAGVSELASLGIDNAYSLLTAGGTASQVRTEGSLLAATGITAGDNIMLGCFLYASDGASFPPGFGSFAIMVSGVTQAMDSTGYVQVSTNVRFMWGKKVVPAGVLEQVIIGFGSAAIGASAATRYHGGFFLHKSALAIDTPIVDSISRYTGWEGQDSSTALFATLEQVAEDYNAGLLGVGDAVPPTLVLGGTGTSAESYIEVFRDGKTIRRTFRPFPATSRTASSVFDFRSDRIDGLAIKSINDDAAPYRAFGTTIGANHGYYMFSVPAASHGKVTADIGSIYSNGGTEWVLIGIIDANTLHIARRTSNASTVAPAGTYTYVSGGSGSSNITVSASGTLAQLYPPFINRVLRVFADGVEVTDTTASLRYSRDVVFMESYDIIERADVIAWYEASGSGGGVQPTGTPAISVSISYVFDHEANCTIYTDFLARKNGISLDNIMFLQAQRMATGVDGTIEYYIPKALPVTHEGTAYDYANIDSSDTAAWTTRLDFTPARCEPTGILCDRVIQLSNNYGFAMGYLPVQSTSLANRRTQATVKALQLSNSGGKIYLSAIDKGSITLNSGDYFSTIGYRNVLVRAAGRTCCYPVRTNGEDYLYVDWHSSGVDRVPVPADMAGRTFEVVEKSANVTVLSQALTNSLVVDVANTATYGYLILKVT